MSIGKPRVGKLRVGKPRVWKWQDQYKWHYVFQSFGKWGQPSPHNGEKFVFLLDKPEKPEGPKIDPDQVWIKLYSGLELACFYAGPRKNQRIANQLNDYLSELEEVKKEKANAPKKAPLPADL